MNSKKVNNSMWYGSFNVTLDALNNNNKVC